jgi:hypothetical protein
MHCCKAISGSGKSSAPPCGRVCPFEYVTLGRKDYVASVDWHRTTGAFGADESLTAKSLGQGTMGLIYVVGRGARIAAAKPQDD